MNVSNLYCLMDIPMNEERLANDCFNHALKLSDGEFDVNKFIENGTMANELPCYIQGLQELIGLALQNITPRGIDEDTCFDIVDRIYTFVGHCEDDDLKCALSHNYTDILYGENQDEPLDRILCREPDVPFTIDTIIKFAKAAENIIIDKYFDEYETLENIICSEEDN